MPDRTARAREYRRRSEHFRNLATLLPPEERPRLLQLAKENWAMAENLEQANRQKGT